MQIIISGKGVNLTDAIESYVTKKINSLEKFFKSIVRIEVIVGKETNHHAKGQIFYAEGKLEVPGRDVFVRKGGTTVYEAVDWLKDHLEKEVKKHKAKLKGNEKKGRMTRRNNKEYSDNF